MSYCIQIDTCRSSLIRVYTVCHSVCIFWMHYNIVKPHNFRINTHFLRCTIYFYGIELFSSPEPKAHWWTYRIGRPHCINILETTGPNKIKFYMELLWDGGTEVCSTSPGHMTKSRSHDQESPHAHIWSYMVKTLKKNNLLWNQKADDLDSWYAAWGTSTTKFVQMMTLGWPWPILQEGQIWPLMLLYG